MHPGVSEKKVISAVGQSTLLTPNSVSREDVDFLASAKDTSFLQVAVGSVMGLELSSRRWTMNSGLGSIVNDAAQLRNGLPPQPQQTAEGHRAVLGVHDIHVSPQQLLSPVCHDAYKPTPGYATFSASDTGSSIHHTSITTAVKLIQEQEYPTYSLLVNLVRIKKMAFKVSDTFQGSVEVANNRLFCNIHSIDVASIRNELDAFVRHLPDDLKSNPTSRTISTRGDF